MGIITVNIEGIPNFHLDEIKQWMLGLGPEAYVVEPEELRRMVQSDLKRSLDQYTQGMVFQVKEPVDDLADVSVDRNNFYPK